MNTISIRKPDDWHVHLRDGELLAETVAATARCFQRAIVMPNLVPPVDTAETCLLYKKRIIDVLSDGSQFTPLMTLYLTNSTSAEEIKAAKQAGIVAAKFYPAGATTNSDLAVSQVEALYPIFDVMASEGMLLLVHGEVTDPDVDIFDREKVFIERHLQAIVSRFPDLKVVLEHITTKDAVEFVEASSTNVAATITVQHLMMNRNDLLVGGIHPHNYCLPVLKRNTHQQALRQIVAKGSPKFFLGTDSAPHEKYRKESSCGCAGCYSAWSALELYTHIFDELGCLDKLEGFASDFGADFYGLERNQQFVTLKRESWQIPEQVTLTTGQVMVPFMAGEWVNWKLSTNL